MPRQRSRLAIGGLFNRVRFWIKSLVRESARVRAPYRMLAAAQVEDAFPGALDALWEAVIERVDRELAGRARSRAGRTLALAPLALAYERTVGGLPASPWQAAKPWRFWISPAGTLSAELVWSLGEAKAKYDTDKNEWRVAVLGTARKTPRRTETT